MATSQASDASTRLRAKRQALNKSLQRRRARIRELEARISLIRKEMAEAHRALDAVDVQALERRPLNRDELRVLKGARRAGEQLYINQPSRALRLLLRARYIRLEAHGRSGAWYRLTKKGEQKVRSNDRRKG